MTIEKRKILRLNMAQWQGGDNPGYRVGSQVLQAIAPVAPGPVETIAVPLADGDERPDEDGIVSRSALVQQLNEARTAIARHDPDAIVTLGGDCLVSLAPFAHLSQKYGDDLAVLWIDAHPDIMTPKQFNHAHAHVLGVLLGEGDPQLQSAVSRPVRSDRILYVGITESTDWETSFIANKGLQCLSPEDLQDSAQPVLEWLRARGATKVAVHYDLDVLDPALYDFLYFRNPAAQPGDYDGIAQGRMRIEQIVDILQQVSAQAQVVGLTIAEYLPWSTMKVADMLASLPLLGGNYAD